MFRTLRATHNSDGSQYLFEFAEGLGPALVVLHILKDTDNDALLNAMALARGLRKLRRLLPDASLVCFVLAPHPQTNLWVVQGDFESFVNGEIGPRLSGMTLCRFQLVPVRDCRTVDSVQPVARRYRSGRVEFEQFIVRIREDETGEGESNENTGGESEVSEDLMSFEEESSEDLMSFEDESSADSMSLESEGSETENNGGEDEGEEDLISFEEREEE